MSQVVKNYFGTWKFTEKVTSEMLEAFAIELANDKNFLSLLIRPASKKQLGLSFEYEDPQEKNLNSFEEFHDWTSDKLKRSFGNGFIGYDVSGYYVKIK